MSSVPSAPVATGNFRPDLAEGMKSYSVEALERGLIGLQIAPVVEVGEVTADIGKYPLKDLLRIHKTIRAMGSPYATGGLELGSFVYNTKDQGFMIPLDERWLKAYRNRYGQAEQHAAETARQIVMTASEKRTIDTAMDATALTGDLTAAVSVSWDNRTTAKPIDDLSAFRQQAAKNGGIMPNSLALDIPGFEDLINNSQVLDRISASGAGDKIKPTDVNLKMLAQALNIDNIDVSGRLANMAGRDVAMDLEYLWPAAQALLYYKGPNPNNPFELNYMNTFHWGEDGSSIGGVIEVDGDWDSRSRKVRSRMDTDEERKYDELGFRITGLR